MKRENLNWSVTKYIQRYCPFMAETIKRQPWKWIWRVRFCLIDQPTKKQLQRIHGPIKLLLINYMHSIDIFTILWNKIFWKFTGEETSTWLSLNTWGPMMYLFTNDHPVHHRVLLQHNVLSGLLHIVWVSAEVSIRTHCSCCLLHNTDIFHSVSISG